MCMFTNTKEAVKAETDIVCYKKVCIEEVSEDPNAVCLRSMYHHFNYTPGEIYTCQLFTPVLPDELSKAVRDGFHTYTEILEALCTYGCESSDEMAVLKCVIPKGTFLYKSHVDNEYCSQCLKVVGWNKISTASLRYLKNKKIKWRTDLVRIRGDKPMPVHKEDRGDIDFMCKDYSLDDSSIRATVIEIE